MTLPLKTETLTYEIPSHNFSVRFQGTIYMYLCARKVSKFQGKVCTIRYNDLRSLYFNHHDFQARRQEFPEGKRGALTAGSRPPEALGYLEQNPEI